MVLDELGRQEWTFIAATGTHWPKGFAFARPALDAGDPEADVGAEPEPNGRRLNMGAYGGTGVASAPESHRY